MQWICLAHLRILYTGIWTKKRHIIDSLECVIRANLLRGSSIEQNPIQVSPLSTLTCAMNLRDASGSMEVWMAHNSAVEDKVS